MADKSTIEWTEATWNPTTGCDRTSPGCANCYALTLSKRLKAMGQPKYQNDGDPDSSGPGFGLTLHPDALQIPGRWRTPRVVFVNSMSDLFHPTGCGEMLRTMKPATFPGPPDSPEAHFVAPTPSYRATHVRFTESDLFRYSLPSVPDDFIRQVFDVMLQTPRHTYQILTKRSQRLATLASELPWPTNVWMGVSVEAQRYAFRLAHLRRVPAAVRFLSVEPLLGPVELDLAGIDWCIVGGESGKGHRPVEDHWIRIIRDGCVSAGVPFFFKQWGGASPKAGGRLLDGRTWDEMPTARVRLVEEAASLMKVR